MRVWLDRRGSGVEWLVESMRIPRSCSMSSQRARLSMPATRAAVDKPSPPRVLRVARGGIGVGVRDGDGSLQRLRMHKRQESAWGSPWQSPPKQLPTHDTSCHRVAISGGGGRRRPPASPHRLDEVGRQALRSPGARSLLSGFGLFSLHLFKCFSMWDTLVSGNGAPCETSGGNTRHASRDRLSCMAGRQRHSTSAWQAPKSRMRSAVRRQRATWRPCDSRCAFRGRWGWRVRAGLEPRSAARALRGGAPPASPVSGRRAAPARAPQPRALAGRLGVANGHRHATS